MKHKHGAVICYTDNKGEVKVICKGYNKKGSFCNNIFPFKYKHSLHAEHDCLRTFGNKLDRYALHLSGIKYMMLVVRFKNGKLMNSKPCQICRRMLNDSILSKVYYSDENGLIKMIDLDEYRKDFNIKNM